MNELTKIKKRILERIEIYIADIELAEEQELTEDEKTIFKSVKNIILEEFDKCQSARDEENEKERIHNMIDEEIKKLQPSYKHIAAIKLLESIKEKI